MHKIRMRLQRAEALGPVNRWFCSQYYGYPVTDENVLVAYYIRHGGAVGFAQRFVEATGSKNRWYCSEYHGREISDLEILWDYYITHADIRISGTNSPAELSMSC